MVMKMKVQWPMKTLKNPLFLSVSTDQQLQLLLTTQQKKKVV
ncbi:hypothetical protein FQN60_015446 [Etheostoma spectabile]|uniref:Uncharacterized protein n=1 Tax=Etheostoma spectabile TaxID=54343 RepID=A0A5J5CR60_9PERO|nr:hypothetical protein FQN60_015446 [Etheostoma spectabile]